MLNPKIPDQKPILGTVGLVLTLKIRPSDLWHSTAIENLVRETDVSETTTDTRLRPNMVIKGISILQQEVNAMKTGKSAAGAAPSSSGCVNDLPPSLLKTAVKVKNPHLERTLKRCISSHLRAKCATLNPMSQRYLRRLKFYSVVCNFT